MKRTLWFAIATISATSAFFAVWWVSELWIGIDRQTAQAIGALAVTICLVPFGWLAHNTLRRPDEEHTPSKVSVRIENADEFRISSMPVPHQLPANISDFSGRAAELAQLDGLVASTHLRESSNQKTVIITAIDGAGGVGKTSLALHWAHRISGQFLDGQIFLNLRGFGPSEPLSTDDALDQILRALDVPPEKIPTDAEAKASLYRSLLHGRRMMIMLDNAASSEQVRLLVPGTSTCIAIVTSRRRLSGLVTSLAARRMSVDVLSPEDAQLLLETIVGTARVDTEPAAAQRIASLCGRLPLAIRVVGEQANRRPHSSLAALAEELELSTDRLGLFDGDDELTGLRNVFDWSYHALTADQSLALCTLGLFRGLIISVNAASALLGSNPTEGRKRLDGLAAVHLLEAASDDSYGCHDLLRSYAKGLSSTELDSAARANAVHRLASWYAVSAAHADRLIMPQRQSFELALADFEYSVPPLRTYEDALRWFESERSNLVAVTNQAADQGLHKLSWQIAVLTRGFMNIRKHWRDWEATHVVALRSAEAAEDRYGEGRVLNGLGTLYKQLGRKESAVQLHERALQRRREMGDLPGEASALDGLGHAYIDSGLSEQAVELYTMSLKIRQTTEHRHGEAWSLNNLGEAYFALGRLDAARANYLKTLPIRREVEDRWGEERTLYNLGRVELAEGRYHLAHRYLSEAAELGREIGDRWGTARSSCALASVLLAAGDSAGARKLLAEALIQFHELHAPEAVEVEQRIFEIDHPSRRPERAV